MFHNGVEDWLGVVTIITILSGWANYIVIKPLKEMIINQGESLQRIDANLDMFKTDIHCLRERVAILEHEVATIKSALDNHGK